jgi:prepilin-type N-terminal cleavage/methylation domain-containing protein
MRSRTENFKSDSGVSLIEVMVVLIIIVIISTIALMNRGKSKDILKRQNAAQELKVAFERARFDSVKRRPDSNAGQARVVVSIWGYTLTTDLDLNGVLNSSDDRNTDVGFQNIAIRNRISGNVPITVYFNKRGEAVDINGNPISPVFDVCNITCNAPNAANSNILLVTPTGTVNLLPGNSRLPVFGVPAINGVPTTTGINQDAVIN